MFFNLEYINDHPCNKMQEVILSFFQESILQKNFGNHLFPDWFQPSIQNSKKLKESFESVFNVLQNQNQDFRQQLYNQIDNNNFIEEICDNTDFFLDSFLDWDSDLGQEMKELFSKKLYAALDKPVFRPKNCNKKPKKSYYEAFIKKNKNVCPFCGMEKFPNPRGKTRSDLDHYLNKARYPFSAANLKNLVPMCKECNQGYKKEKSVIDFEGNRTPAFYPFGEHPPIYLNVECQHFPKNIDDVISWKVTLSSDENGLDSKIDTWDRVFEIKGRIKEELEEYYEDWMETFVIDELSGQKKLENLVDFRAKLLSYAEKQKEKMNIRIEVNTIIKHAFFSYMTSDAPDFFLNGFLELFNHRMGNQAA